MMENDYVRGFTDALEMVLLEFKRVKDLEDLRRRVELMLGLAVEHKIDKIAQRLGYPLHY